LAALKMDNTDLIHVRWNPQSGLYELWIPELGKWEISLIQEEQNMLYAARSGKVKFVDMFTTPPKRPFHTLTGKTKHV
jgi:hypothetical protein